MTEHVHDEGCICRGNWRAIVKETEHLIGDKYTNSKEEVFSFFGIVHGGDDYYYGMWRKGQLNLLSCVGSIEGHGYTPFPKFRAEIFDVTWTKEDEQRLDKVLQDIS